MKILKKLSIFIMMFFVSITLISCSNNSTNNNGTGSGGGTESVSTNYTVTFLIDEIVCETQTISQNEKVKEPQTPIKDNFTFLGWFDGEEKWDFENTVSKNLSLVAKFLGEYDEDGYKVIATKEKLREYAENSENYSVNARLYADINLGGIEWTPIGNHNESYSAKFDGNGFTISNFKLTKYVYSDIFNIANVGFFGVVLNGEVKNLNLKNYEINVNCEKDITSDCYVEVGGLAGFVVNSTIENCSVSENIYAKGLYLYVGGLIGSVAKDVIVKNCYSLGDVFVEDMGDSYCFVGGLIGDIERGAIISNSFAKGKVTASSVGGRAYAGGLVGYSEENTKIDCCYAIGEIKSSSTYDNAYAGGLVSYIISSEISNCYSSGNVNSSASVFAYSGGLIGYLKSTKTSYSYATGKSESYSCYESVSGGLIGGVLENGNEDAEILNCFATGNVSAKISNITAINSYAGGLVGTVYNNKIIKNSHRFFEQEVISSDAENTELTGIVNNSGTKSYMFTIWAFTMEYWYADNWELSFYKNPILKI